MTQDEKSILLKDLCARLPYGVKIHKALYGATTLNERDIESFRKGFDDILIPYLRPMSSMTEEEKEELKQISNNYLDEWENTKTSLERWKLDAKVSYKRAVFYNSHHIDWNDLISKCLALEAPEGFYNPNFKVVEFDHFRNTKERKRL